MVFGRILDRTRCVGFLIEKISIPSEMLVSYLSRNSLLFLIEFYIYLLSRESCVKCD